MNVARLAALLLQFGFRPIRGSSHAERLESFYHYQADSYDQFRQDYLKGREDIIAGVGLSPGCCWADFGCGTGYLLQAAGESAQLCKRITLIDLCPSLLKIAERRIKELGLSNAEILESDCTTNSLDQYDCITMSYSLSMIPNWFSAIDNAHAALKPNGRIGIADFLVARKYPEFPVEKQPWITRQFWPLWFGWDNVWPNPDHIPYLASKFNILSFKQERTRIPGLPFLRPPCYQLVGVRKG